MRLCFVSQFRISNFSTIHGKAFSEARSFSENAINQTLLCFSDGSSISERRLSDTFRLVAIPVKVTNSFFQTLMSMLRAFIVTTITLHSTIKENQIDLVRAENTLLGGIPAYLNWKILKAPYIIWLGGSEEDTIILRYGNGVISRITVFILRIIKRIVLRNAIATLCVSSRLLDDAHKLGGKKPIKTNNFVDLNRFYPNKIENTLDDSWKFIFVGRLEIEKGIIPLLEASRILRDNANIMIQVVGKGTLQEYVLQKCLENPILDFLGFFAHDEIAEKLRSVNAFVLPSFTEGFPASVLEAMACGLPIIASRVGEIPSIVRDGIDGLLVKPGNTDELVKAMEWMEENQSKAKKMGISCRQRAIQISGNYITDHIKLYNHLIAEL